MKKIFCGLISLILIISCLSACTCNNNLPTLKVYLSTIVFYKPQILSYLTNYAQEKNINLEIIEAPDYSLNDEQSLQARRTFIQQQRAKIMSGDAPDIYIGNIFGDGCNNEMADLMLFNNGYKSMQAGIFADLSNYIKNSTELTNNIYNYSLLNAGTINNKNYFLPLGYTMVYMGTNSNSVKSGLNIEQIFEDKNITQNTCPNKPKSFFKYFLSNLKENCSMQYGYLEYKLLLDDAVIDVNQNTANFDINDIQNSLKILNEFDKEYTDFEVGTNYINTFNNEITKNNNIYGFFVPNNTGGYTAQIDGFGVALSQNCNNKDIAFELLQSLICDNEFQKIVAKMHIPANNNLALELLNNSSYSPQMQKNICYAIKNINDAEFVSDGSMLLTQSIAEFYNQNGTLQELPTYLQQVQQKIEIMLNE